MKLLNIVIVVSVLLFVSCGQKLAENPVEQSVVLQNSAHEMVYNMIQKVGTLNDLAEKKDVIYTYTYTTPDGAEDISTEKYVFDGELSYATYRKHERTLTDLAGTIEQGYDGRNFWLRHNGKYIEDEKAMNRVIFNRKTNFYWFAMFQKLLDPGLKYEFVKEGKVDVKEYDIVKVSFTTDDGEPKDIYQLYINKETLLVDQFLFTVAYFGVENPFLMKMKYEEVDGILIPTIRDYTQANWEGENLNENWIKVRWTDIQFDNGLSKELFTK